MRRALAIVMGSLLFVSVADARPVRSEARSCLSAAIAPCILRLRSFRSNIAAMGLEGCVMLKQANVIELSAPAPDGVLVTNPPYGVRLGESENLSELYPQLGDVLKTLVHRFVQALGWTSYISNPWPAPGSSRTQQWPVY